MTVRFWSRLRHILLPEEGATLVEYAFLVMLIALVAAAAVYVLGGEINEMYTRLKDCIVNRTPTC